MKKYIDENNNIITESELKADYNEFFNTDEYFKDAFPTFADYEKDCTGKNGTLTRI